MAQKAGLFQWIRETSFLRFMIGWTVSIFVFMFIYWIISAFGPGINTLIVNGSAVNFTFLGLVDSLYASFLSATIFGTITLVATGIFRIIMYVQLVFSALILLILIDKIMQKYVFPHYHIYHGQDKKINTMLLTMTIFREDIERLKAEFKTNTKHHIDLREIEAAIDGLYVTFLEIEKMFSVRNMHKHSITDHQHMMVIINIEDSLHKLSRFIDFLDEHKIEWKDKSIEFWLRYILETADKITLHFEDVKVKNPKLIIAIENIKEHTIQIERKL